MQDLVYPDVNRDTADVLLANGCVRRDAAAPAVLRLAARAQRRHRTCARELARRMIDLAVAGALRRDHQQRRRMRVAPPPLRDAARRRSRVRRERRRAWDSKVRDVHEWLVEIGCRAPKVGPFDSSVTVTYHESCHLAHGQRIVRQPRALLGMLPGLSVVELKESTWCCGSAGIYALSQPEQAERLLQRKVAHVLDTGATIVATGNPGCQMQLAKGLRDSGRAVRVVHPISLVAAAYRREAGAGRLNRFTEERSSCPLRLQRRLPGSQAAGAAGARLLSTRARHVTIWLLHRAGGHHLHRPGRAFRRLRRRCAASSASTGIQMGWAFSVFGWAYAFFEVPGGWLGDRVGRAARPHANRDLVVVLHGGHGLGVEYDVAHRDPNVVRRG